MAYRDRYGAGMAGPRLTPWVTRLLIALTAVFLALFVTDDLLHLGLTRWLVFVPAAFLRAPWTVLTYPFVQREVLSLLFQLLMLYFFAGQLEEHWGSRGFLQFFAASAVGGALLGGVLALIAPPIGGMPVLGPQSAIYGMLLAFAMLWPDMEINIWGIFPVKAKWLALFSAVIGFIISVQNGGFGLAHLGGFVTGFLFLKSPWAPRAWGELPARKAPRRVQQKAVVPWGGKKDLPAGGTRTVVPAAARRTARAEKDLLDDVDRILDKISAEGLTSLTEEERKRLDEVSRRYRTN